MAVPFPSPPPVQAYLNYTPKHVFRATPPPSSIAWFDENSLQGHQASVTSNDGKTLVVSSGGKSYTYDLTGDGSACIPVTPLPT